MSLSVQTARRLPIIKEGLMKGLNYTQIGKKCGVTKRTIDRDVRSWLATGDFELWLKQEWVRLHNIIIHADPTEAYRQVTKILGKMVTRKAEIKTEHKEEIKIGADINLLLRDYEQAISNAVQRNIQADNPTKQVRPTQTHPQTS